MSNGGKPRNLEEKTWDRTTEVVPTQRKSKIGEKSETKAKSKTIFSTYNSNQKTVRS